MVHEENAAPRGPERAREERRDFAAADRLPRIVAIAAVVGMATRSDRVAALFRDGIERP